MSNLKKNLLINVLIIMVSLFLFKGISYSANNEPTKDNKDLVIKTGNMEVVLNTVNENSVFFNSLNELISDEMGLNQEGYKFSIKNTGNIKIEYYEIRLVDQEGKVSTLPHKYLRYTVSKDSLEFNDIKNLGDNDSIIYSGYNLDIGESSSFNLKMWIDKNEMDALGKELYGAIEITLYQKYDVYKNYVLYESSDSTNVPIRTSIYNPISSTIPKKDGYIFVGWEDKNGNIKYYPGESYQEKIGTTLYAIWEKE